MTSQYHIYSFYQWGRVYHYSGASENVINIRNATLIFGGTSLPQTPDNLVTIHEQVMYTVQVPVPPIPSNLSVSIGLPQFKIFLETWEVLKLREEFPPHPLPIEGTFLRQGCFPNETTITDACFCSTSLLGNSTFYRVYPDWLITCMEIPRENCTGGDSGRALFEGEGGNQSSVNQSSVNQSSVNQSSGNYTSGNYTSCNATSCNYTQCGYNSTANCTLSNDTIAQDFVSTPETCVYDIMNYNVCIQTVFEECQINSSITILWSHIFGKAPLDDLDTKNGSLSNQTQESNWTQTQATPTQQPLTNQTTPTLSYANLTTANQGEPSTETASAAATPTQQPPANQTSASPSYASQTTPAPSYANQTAANQSEPTSQTAPTADEYSAGLSCAQFAEAFCQVATLHRCILPEVVYNETGGAHWNATCACNYYEPPPSLEPEPTCESYLSHRANVLY